MWNVTVAQPRRINEGMTKKYLNLIIFITQDKSSMDDHDGGIESTIPS